MLSLRASAFLVLLPLVTLSHARVPVEIKGWHSYRHPHIGLWSRVNTLGLRGGRKGFGKTTPAVPSTPDAGAFGTIRGALGAPEETGHLIKCVCQTLPPMCIWQEDASK